MAVASTYAQIDRLWFVLSALNRLTTFPILPAPPIPRTPSQYFLQRAELAMKAGLLSASDLEMIRKIVAEWHQTGPLNRELVCVVLQDCETLGADPVALDQAKELYHRWRTQG